MTIKKILIVLFFGLASVAAQSALAVEGKVVWVNAKCGMHLVFADNGYGLIQQLSAGPLSEGDVLDGPLDLDGKTHSIQNVTTGLKLMVWVEKYSSSKKIAMSRLPPNCRPKEEAAPAAQ